jgi:hypothetical protein
MTLKARCRSKPNSFSLIDFFESLIGNATHYFKLLDELRAVIRQFDDFIRHLHSPGCWNTEPLFYEKSTSHRFHHSVCPIVARRWGRQRPFFSFVKLDRFFHNLTQFRENRFLVISMATTVNEPRATADETIVFFGPFNKFHISRRSVHDLDSSIALLTARSWYVFASSPALPDSVTGFETSG